MTHISSLQPTTDVMHARQQALGQARMWRTLALQCHALADRRMAAEAEAIANSYERRAEKLKPLAEHNALTG